MAINRYDQPAQSQVINTYSPIPFQEIQQAALAKQGRYDESVAMEEALASQLGGPALEYLQNPYTGKYDIKVGDYDIVQATSNKLEEQLNNLATTAGTSDKGDPTYRRALRQTYRDIGTAKRDVFDPATQNIQRYKEIQKRVSEADVKDQRFLLGELSRQLQGYGQRSLQSDRVGILDAPANIGDYVNRAEEADKLIKGIEGVITQVYDNIDDINGFISTGQLKETTEQKIRDAANRLLDQSVVGTSIRNEYQERIAQGEDPNQVDSDIRYKQRTLVDGLVAKYVEQTRSRNIKGISGFDRKKLDSLGTPLVFERPIDTSKINTQYDNLLNKLYFDENNNFVKVNLDETTDPNVRAALASQKIMPVTVSRTTSTKKIADELLNQYGNAPELQNKSDKDKLTNIINFIKTNSVNAFVKYGLEGDKIQSKLKQELTNSLATANLHIEGNDGTTTNIAGKDGIAKSLGMSATELSEMLTDKNLLVRADYMNGKFIIELPDSSKKKGKAGHKEIIFDLDLDSQAAFGIASEVNTRFHDVNNYTLEDSELIPIGDNTFVSVIGNRDITNPKANNKKVIVYDAEDGRTTEWSIRQFNNFFTNERILKNYK